MELNLCTIKINESTIICTVVTLILYVEMACIEVGSVDKSN